MVKLKLFVVLFVIIALSGCIEDVIRVVDTYPLQYINASNITVIGASATSGELSNISDINGGYFNISEGNAQPYYVIVNFTNITNFSFLEVKSKYFSTSGTPSSHVVDLEIYCSTDNEYEDLFFLENANEWRYFTRHFPDSMHFIDAQGNVSIKFNHTANGNNNHRLYIDTVRLIIKESFEQNTITLYQNFTTIGGSGGVSFNGNPVNLNESNLFNGTIANYSTLDYTNSSLNLKVNKSGDNMTGRLNISVFNGTHSGFTMLGSAGTPYTTYYENTTMRSELTYGGIQIWKIRNAANVEVGYIVYSTPNDFPGIVFYNSSLSRRINLMARSNGVMLNAGNTSAFKSTGLLVDTDDNITVDGLAGTGYRPLCASPSGKVVICP